MGFEKRETLDNIVYSCVLPSIDREMSPLFAHFNGAVSLVPDKIYCKIYCTSLLQQHWNIIHMRWDKWQTHISDEDSGFHFYQ